MKEFHRFHAITAGLVLSLAGFLVGCGEGEPPVSEKTKADSNRLSDIRDRTGYSWDKATEADKQFLKDTCHGDEGCAKQLLYRPAPGGQKRRPTPGGGAPPPPAPVGG